MMQVYKFGGASVKDAAAVKNLVDVLRLTGTKERLIIVSAMGKTTNALEQVVAAYFNNKTQLPNSIRASISFHESILNELFPKGHNIFNDVQTLFGELKGFLAWNKSPQYDFVYDQVVCYGELISTTIISAYLNEEGIPNTWVDARELIQTDINYRDARVNWEASQKAIKKQIDRKALSITQGFIGSDPNNFTTTLGREGSDYTGGIFAYCLDAENLTIWKDVPGILNADPRVFENTELLQQISYEEAIELAFYGASVIHPKTLQPLQRKEIPLFVKSFMHPKNEGTIVRKGQTLIPELPCYIVKKDQVLISLSSLDFSFMMEENIGAVFKLLGTHKMKVDVIQNSAISFSVCVHDKFNNLEALSAQLKRTFKVKITPGVSLFTIRHATPDAIARIERNKTILLKQIAQETVQLVALD